MQRYFNSWVLDMEPDGNELVVKPRKFNGELITLPKGINAEYRFKYSKSKHQECLDTAFNEMREIIRSAALV